jgi:hypothetical protein
MKTKLLALLWLLASGATAQEARVLSLRELSMEGYQVKNRRDSFLEYKDPAKAEGEEHWVGGYAATFALDLIKYGDYGLYHLDRVFCNGTNAQVREVGHQWEAGAQLGPYLQVFYQHESRHVLDAARDERFPLTNYIGGRITFYKRDR